MTLERIKGRPSFICDGRHCSDSLDEANFEELREAAREAKWKMRYNGRDWTHYCALCWKERERQPDLDSFLKGSGL